MLRLGSTILLVALSSVAGANQDLAFPEELVPKKLPGRNGPNGTKQYAESETDKTSLSGEKGGPSFQFFVLGGGGKCQGTFVSRTKFVTAAHCVGKFAAGKASPMDVSVVSKQFGVANGLPRKIEAKAWVSPVYKEGFPDHEVHDFAVIEIDPSVADRPEIQAAKRAPLCDEADYKANLKVKLSSHRTGEYYDAFIDERDTSNSLYRWKSIDKYNLPIQLMVTQGGVIAGDSGGAAILPKGCLGGVLSRMNGSGGSLGAKYTSYSKVTDWVREIVGSGSTGRPASNAKAPPAPSAQAHRETTPPSTRETASLPRAPSPTEPPSSRATPGNVPSNRSGAREPAGHGTMDCNSPEIQAFLNDGAPSTAPIESKDFLSKIGLKTGSFAPLQLNSVAPKALLGKVDTQKVPKLPPKVVKALLKNTPFSSVMGVPWLTKSEGKTASWGPVSDDTFHVFPKGAYLSHLKLTQGQCNVCHDTAGKHVKLFDPHPTQMNAVEPTQDDGGTRTWYHFVSGFDRTLSFHPFTWAATKNMGPVLSPDSLAKCLGGNHGLFESRQADRLKR